MTRYRGGTYIAVLLAPDLANDSKGAMSYRCLSICFVFIALPASMCVPIFSRTSYFSSSGMMAIISHARESIQRVRLVCCCVQCCNVSGVGWKYFVRLVRFGFVVTGPVACLQAVATSNAVR
jgi:hypothetical protein